MKFKEFLQITEDGQGSGDNGLMGGGKKSSVTTPEMGQPFKKLGSFAGQEPRPNGGGAGGGMGGNTPMFMKKMKKRMKKS